jgi:hypothetical protein
LDPDGDLILGMILIKVVGFSISELSNKSADRLLKMFVEGVIDPYPSPGEIATEAFIERSVLPYCLKPLQPSERAALEQLLYDASGTLGRRFRFPSL